MPSKPAISVKGLCVDRSGQQVLADLKLDLQPGQSMLLVGANGSGKTTLLRTLSGLLRPTTGSACVFGLEAGEVTTRQLITNGVRYLAQGTRCFGSFSVRKQRTLLSRLYEFSLEQAGPIPETALDARRAVERLSIGERKLEALRMLRVGEPRVYFLDEPVAGLDQRWRDTISDWISAECRRGVACLVAEHEFRSLLPFVDSVAILKGGTLATVADAAQFRGNPQQLLELL